MNKFRQNSEFHRRLDHLNFLLYWFDTKCKGKTKYETKGKFSDIK